MIGCREDRPNVIVITIDTLRADHLGCYGHEKIKTPNIDRLAEEGVLFTQCIAAAPITLPSHASIMTGTYPIYHGVHDNGTFRLDGRFTTLAEVMKDAGYQTGAFVSSFPLSSRFGLDQGFDHYDDRFQPDARAPTVLFPERKGAETTTEALNWLESKKDNPFFLWVHYFDPHQRCEPPEPFFTEYKDNLYGGEIAFVDAQVGTLAQYLKDNNLYENTVIVVTSDHGESLGEHNELTHMIFTYDATMHVPLIFRIPEAKISKRKVTELVRGIDIMPTLLDLLGLDDSGSDVQGQSLISLYRGEEETERVAYIESEGPTHHFNWASLRGIRTDRYKYIEAPKPELYDLQADPRELTNLYRDERAKSREFREMLNRVLEDYSYQDLSDLSNRAKMDRESLDKLQSLGYIFASFGESSPDEALPDPKDKIMHWHLASLGMNLMVAEKYEAALKIFRIVEKIDPGNVLSCKFMITCLAHQGQYPAIVDAFERLKGRLEGRINYSKIPMLYRFVAAYLEILNKTDDAAAVLENLVLTGNSSKGIYEFIGVIYNTRGDSAKAREAFRREVENSGSSTARLKLANLLMREKNYGESLSEFLHLSRLAANDAWIERKIGTAYYYLKDYDQSFSHLKEARRLGEDVPEGILAELSLLAQGDHVENKGVN
jgi:arylsulfatase A-like enzyme